MRNSASSVVLQAALPILAVMGASAICTGMLVARALAFRTFDYWFLGFNLLLAWIPLCAATAFATLMHRDTPRLRWLPGMVLLALWLVFLPNAPYLLTDIFHWRRQASWLGWFELLMLVSFGLTGLMIGFAALRLVHHVIAQQLGTWWGWLFVAVTSAATGVGVYLGRFQRWNSWDLASPAADDIVISVLRIVQHPQQHAMPLAFSMVVAAIFLCGYLFFACGRLPAAATLERHSK